ncbi:hypothetical protein FHS18_005752 [Paenibacillus phyllosphaerae]|uniref:Uncharacterized protein n=1 Tax=Paenibacillus phyllosphaerae TaxID=274593 RepID=A0A7W5FR35_9BACL|nr:hypothetical protein [Paenibacillus phyllosphaerae]MBB3113639.1 hypothetical protein [Paenibacillus phyllosphaerae]
MNVLRLGLAVVVYCLSFWIGFLAYEASLWTMWEQRVSSGERQAVIGASMLIYIPLGLVYLLITTLITNKIKLSSGVAFGLGYGVVQKLFHSGHDRPTGLE